MTSPTPQAKAVEAEAVQELAGLVESYIVGSKHVRVRVTALRRVLSSHASLFSQLVEREQEVERLRGQPENDTWWKTVIGDTHVPSGEVSVKHLHPLTVKPIYEAHKGTVIADVIAGLIFEAALTRNREKFLVDDANTRSTDAEAKLVESEAREGALREALTSLVDNHYDEDGIVDPYSANVIVGRDSRDTLQLKGSFIAQLERAALTLQGRG